ncbi:hypothetical protein [Pseudomonas sichuanensis]|uniref:Secreted protein n=1 Tax=Pseudomonas sichuanensis TaxID=2213015 RepID=A0ABV0DHK5_9PSED
MSCALALFLSPATAVHDDGCTQAAHPMQQHERGATTFHLQVAPNPAFSDETVFLLHFGANTTFSITKNTEKDRFRCTETPFRRVAPLPRKIRVAPGCTRIVLQANLASSLGHTRGQ